MYKALYLKLSYVTQIRDVKNKNWDVSKFALKKYVSYIVPINILYI